MAPESRLALLQTGQPRKSQPGETGLPVVGQGELVTTDDRPGEAAHFAVHGWRRTNPVRVLSPLIQNMSPPADSPPRICLFLLSLLQRSVLVPSFPVGGVPDYG